jgi:hypothetical protein
MNKRENQEIIGDQNKKSKLDSDTDANNDLCIVCMRSHEELMAADCPMMDQHNCSQCNKSSWKICEVNNI